MLCFNLHLDGGIILRSVRCHLKVMNVIGSFFLKWKSNQQIRALEAGLRMWMSCIVVMLLQRIQVCRQVEGGKMTAINIWEQCNIMITYGVFLPVICVVALN